MRHNIAIITQTEGILRFRDIKCGNLRDDQKQPQFMGFVIHQKIAFNCLS